MEPIILVSADGHASAPPETFRPYLEGRYLPHLDDLIADNERYTKAVQLFDHPPQVLEIIDHDNAIGSGGLTGGWDVNRRLQEMDREGVAAEIVIHGTQQAITPWFGADNPPHPAELRTAGRRAYHRWLADGIASSDGRLFGVALPGPCLDMDEAVSELRWVAEHGFRSVLMPGYIADPDMPPLHDAHFEPFWSACADLDLSLTFHAGDGYPQGQVRASIDQLLSGMEGRSIADLFAMLEAGGSDSAAADSPFELDSLASQVMWAVMLAGVFDRYPSVKLVLTEVRADWVPATLKVLDDRFARGGTPLAKSPSEYWHQHCWVGCSAIKHSEVRLRKEIGIERMMFGRDYPHPESTWPNTMEWLQVTLGGVSEPELRRLLGENAIDCYGLDRQRLASIAQRIGSPSPADILGEHAVDPHVIETFRMRGGIDKSYEHIDDREIADLFERDLARVTGGTETDKPSGPTLRNFQMGS